MNPSRPRGIAVVALVMIIFGAAEIMTSLTQAFFGIVTAASAAANYADMLIGIRTP